VACDIGQWLAIETPLGKLANLVALT